VPGLGHPKPDQRWVGTDDLIGNLIRQGHYFAWLRVIHCGIDVRESYCLGLAS
jgi:hypothetical protein